MDPATTCALATANIARPPITATAPSLRIVGGDTEVGPCSQANVPARKGMLRVSASRYDGTMRCALLVVAAFFGCARSNGEEKRAIKAEPPTDKASASVAASLTRKAKVEPMAVNALPICGSDVPLAALCKIGGDAMSARFECKNPEPLMFCSKTDEWSCKYMSFAGETPPAVTFQARFDHKGPKVETGVVLDLTKFKREGVVRGVAVHFRVADDPAGKRRAQEIAAEPEGFGCVTAEQGYRAK